MTIIQSKHPIVAHKFGGSSLADAGKIKRVRDILLARRDETQIVVVSAMQGVTDALIRVAALAAKRDASWTDACLQLEQRHLKAAHELLGLQGRAIVDTLEKQFLELRDLLHALALLGAPAEDALLYIQGLGEVMSAQMVAAHFAASGHGARYVDAREVLTVRREELGAVVDWEASRANLARVLNGGVAERLIVTGFVARNPQGQAVTLGRNGSDYSAAIFASLLEAEALHIWTDVDGVLSADPRLVPEAVLVPELTYAEACELAYFGAKVIHPQTMQPAIAKRIPIRIRNTFNPAHEGSLITAEAGTRQSPIRGITAINDLALITVEGAGMIGVPGTAERVFTALHRAGVSVVMISQGSSEHSICCAIEARHSESALHALREAFARELERGQIQRVFAEPDVSVLAIVGEGMAGTPGIASRLFEALARSQINVRAIAQGASERNISVAVASGQAAKALRAVHAGFYLSPQTISIGLIGPGQVGKAFLDQLAKAKARLLQEAQLDLRVRAIADSRSMSLHEREIALDDCREKPGAGVPLSLEAFVDHVHAPHLPHALIVDCSASSAIAGHYRDWLARGIHVITPNKQAGSGSIRQYQAIKAAASGRSHARFRYEATVGAGLPIIQTLRDLIDTGDEIVAIEGILSGTLAWLFNRYDGQRPFSELVLEAKAAGYTEPDPRDDLSGKDVARKLVILAREWGLTLELSDVAVQSLVPDALIAASKEEFLQNLSELDEPIARQWQTARAQGAVLRYMARLDQSGKATVSLAPVPPDHAFAHIRLTDNIVQFTTRRYATNPLVVQGPGAGPEVTAAGVFADLLRVASGLGAAI